MHIYLAIDHNFNHFYNLIVGIYEFSNVYISGFAPGFQIFHKHLLWGVYNLCGVISVKDHPHADPKTHTDPHLYMQGNK